MDQTKMNTDAPGFAREHPAPSQVKEYPGNQGSVDPKTDGGGMGGNGADILKIGEVGHRGVKSHG